MLHVSNLHKRYGDLEVVRNLSFDVPAGQCFGLLGPNGAGKTTTLPLLSRPHEAGLRNDPLAPGLPVPDRAREARVRVGVVPQFDTLDPDFTVTENLDRLRPLLRLVEARMPRARAEAARFRRPRGQGERADRSAVAAA